MKYFWPDMDDSKSAHQACRTAAVMSFFVAIATGVVSWLQSTGKINIFPGMDKVAFVDVALFILIGSGLIFCSRIAALAGVLLYVGERIYMIKASGFNASMGVSAIIFGMIFVNGVRGAFAWHEFKKQNQTEALRVMRESAIEDKPKKAFPTKLIFLLVTLLVVAGAAYYFLINKGSLPSLDGLKQKMQSGAKSVPAKKVTVPLVAPKGTAIKLTLKNGRAFDGILVKKNSEGYWVFIDGTGEVFFSVNEVEKVV